MWDIAAESDTRVGAAPEVAALMIPSWWKKKGKEAPACFSSMVSVLLGLPVRSQ